MHVRLGLAITSAPFFWRVIFVLLFIVVSYLALTPAPPQSIDLGWDKLNHMTAFATLAAVGCLPPGQIKQAASDIYTTGIHKSELGLRVRRVAVGASRSADLAAAFPEVTQLVWPEMLAFIWDRFHTYRRQKANVQQWDFQGKLLKTMANQSSSSEQFVTGALARMGVRNAA